MLAFSTLVSSSLVGLTELPARAWFSLGLRPKSSRLPGLQLADIAPRELGSKLDRVLLQETFWQPLCGGRRPPPNFYSLFVYLDAILYDCSLINAFSLYYRLRMKGQPIVKRTQQKIAH